MDSWGVWRGEFSIRSSKFSCGKALTSFIFPLQGQSRRSLGLPSLWAAALMADTHMISLMTLIMVRLSAQL